MNKDEMKEGFAKGRTLTQEEWSKPEEIKAVDELIAEGKCKVIRDWAYHDNFQCEFRKVRGIIQSP